MNTRAYLPSRSRRLPLGLGGLVLAVSFALSPAAHAGEVDEFSLLRASTLELLHEVHETTATAEVTVAEPSVAAPTAAWTPDLSAAGRRALESAVVLPAAEKDALLAGEAGAKAEESPLTLSSAPAESAPAGASL